jgi:hypothetical protein
MPPLGEWTISLSLKHSSWYKIKKGRARLFFLLGREGRAPPGMRQCHSVYRAQDGDVKRGRTRQWGAVEGESAVPFQKS